MMRMRSSGQVYGRVVLALIAKDVRAELRTRDTLTTLVTFALIVITIFGFAMNPVERRLEDYFAGIYWLGMGFAALVALGRSFAREREARTLEALAMLPADRSAVYVAKAAVTLLWMLVMVVLMTPLFFVFLNIDVPVAWTAWGAVAVAGIFGFISVGTLLAALAVNLRGADLLLPLLFFPLTVPVLLAAVRLTDALIQGQSLAAHSQWFQLLIWYDIVFFVACLVLFDFAAEV